MPTKLLRPNVGIYVATSDAFANWATPTLGEVTNATKVFNISPAIADNYTLNMTDSDVDNSLSLADSAQVNTPTLYNYEASLDGFRDSNLAATSVYNKFRDLFTVAAGTKYYLIKRIGKAHDAAWAVGDIISIFGVTTDNPVDIVADGAMIMLGARFLTTGEVKVNLTLAGTVGTAPALASTVGTKMQSNANIAAYWVPLASVSNEATFLATPSAAIVNGGIKLTNAVAWDGYELGATDSNKIDDKGIADAANSQSKGFSQFSGSLTFFRGKFPTQTGISATGTSAGTTLTVTNATSLVEVGMAVTGTGVGTGAIVTSVVGTTVTVSVANTATVSTATFTSDYSLAYDTFKATTGSRPSGYLVSRIGAGTGAIASGDKVNVFKFIADAVSDNTEGEDSVKFITKFQPQGLLGVWVTAAA
jgi:hypothetical protein